MPQSLQFLLSSTINHNPMDSNIRKFLDDLYELDPNLRQDEDRLVKIVGMLIHAKPQPVLDQNFVSQLRQQLIPQNPPRNFEENVSKSNIKDNFMKRINIAMGALAICAILVLGGLYVGNQKLGTRQISFNNNPKIVSAGENAFGKLDNVTQIEAKSEGGGGNGALDASLSATADVAAPTPSGVAYGMGGGGDARMSILPPYESQTYNYVYKGEALDLSEAKREVLKREKGEAVSVDLNNLLGSISLGLINLNSFPNLRLQSASFVQKSGDAYSVYVNVDESSININGMWPQPMPLAAESTTDSKLCIEGPNCGNVPPQIKLSDIPADDELISIANSFVSEFGIPTQAYGTPLVQDDWRIYYNLTEDKTNYYLPEVVNVIYPLMIKDQFIYDEGGNKTGLNVGIHVKTKKVMSVWDLSLQNYQSSMYDSETDSERILKVAARGGMYGYVDPNAKKVIDIELGSPTIEFVKMWNYKNNTNEELLIPSLIFPVLNQPEIKSPYPFYRKSVIVPLVKEILDRDQNNGGPIIYERASEPAVAQ